MSRDAFPDYDEPVNIDMEPEEALKLLLQIGGNDKPIQPDSDLIG
jgi:hypothetical protein